MEPKRITAEELKSRMDSSKATGARIAVLDDRAADAWQTSSIQIPGSLRVPPDEVEQHLQKIPKEAAIITYCT